MMNRKIKIALADDHTLFRQGLIALLHDYDEIKVVTEVPNGLFQSNIFFSRVINYWQASQSGSRIEHALGAFDPIVWLSLPCEPSLLFSK